VRPDEDEPLTRSQAGVNLCYESFVERTGGEYARKALIQGFVEINITTNEVAIELVDCMLYARVGFR
jgi:citrate lyase gamma subunit